MMISARLKTDIGLAILTIVGLLMVLESFHSG
jgi:hypothetical protein